MNVVSNAILVVCIFLSACTSQEHAANPAVYQPSSSPMSDVQQAIDKAKSSNKLLLLVLGAQWCHDSRGLASQFASPELAPLLTKHYEILYLDVAYFNDLRAITERFGQPHYYATPTVMLINPNTNELLNAATMDIWGRADSIAQSEYIDYFEKHSDRTNAVQQNISAQHLQTIKRFEQAQGERLAQAYKVLIPGLKTNDNSAEFYALWTEVKTYRTRLQKDIQALYAQAHNAPNESLVLPEYPAFSWANSAP